MTGNLHRDGRAGCKPLGQAAAAGAPGIFAFLPNRLPPARSSKGEIMASSDQRNPSMELNSQLTLDAVTIGRQRTIGRDRKTINVCHNSTCERDLRRIAKSASRRESRPTAQGETFQKQMSPYVRLRLWYNAC
jgi:hypothetical protein